MFASVNVMMLLSVCRNYYTYQQVTMKNGAQWNLI